MPFCFPGGKPEGLRLAFKTQACPSGLHLPEALGNDLAESRALGALKSFSREGLVAAISLIKTSII